MGPDPIPSSAPCSPSRQRVPAHISSAGPPPSAPTEEKQRQLQGCESRAVALTPTHGGTAHTMQTKNATPRSTHRRARKLPPRFVESRSGWTSPGAESPSLATRSTKRHDSTRGTAQRLLTRRATAVIVAVVTVLTLCAACQRQPSYSPSQQQNPTGQSTCVPSPGAHCGAGTGGGGGAGTGGGQGNGTGGGGGAGTGGGQGNGTGGTACVPRAGAHCGADIERR